MKVSYNRECDVLLIFVSEGKVDYAEEMGPIIVHFTKNGKPVLLERLKRDVGFVCDGNLWGWYL